MPKNIILLADSSTCTNAKTIAYYLHHAYKNKGANIILYDYKLNCLYLYQEQQKQFVQRQNNNTINITDYIKHKLNVFRECNNTATYLRVLQEIKKLTKVKESTTALNVDALADYIVLKSCGIIKSIMTTLGGGQNDNCFVIAPNGRNVPYPLLTFGHKLQYQGDNVNYTHKRKKNNQGVKKKFKINTTDDEADDAICTLTEIYLCKGIIDSPGVKYFGNCYGAQIMWVALGGGVTSFKRDPSGARQQTMVEKSAYDQDTHYNVNWGNGVYLSENVTKNKHPLSEMYGSIFDNNNYNKVEYNTDYHHNYLMIDIASTHNNEYIRTAVHELAGKINNYSLTNNPNTYLKKIKRYSGNYERDEDSRITKTNKRWAWVGIYGYQDRIFGFQGHPLYHITKYSAGWNVEITGYENMGDNSNRVENTKHEETAKFVWEDVFKFG